MSTPERKKLAREAKKYRRDDSNSQSKRRAKVLKWRKERKADLMAKEGVAFGYILSANEFWMCPFSHHWMRQETVELCHKRAVGMRGDGDTDENTFLGCRNGNRAQGSVDLDTYLKLPLETRRKNCGL